MRAFLTLSVTVFRLYVRDPLTVLLSLALIVFMMVLFGLVMGDELFEVDLPLAIVDGADNDASRELIASLDGDVWLSARLVADEAEALELIRRAQVISALVVTPEFTGQPAADGKLAGLLVIRDDDATKWIDLGLDQLRSRLAAADAAMPWETRIEPVRVIRSRYIDFIFPGILAMSIMQICLASGTVLLEARKRGVLRRLQLTPISSASIVGGFLAGRFLIVVLHLLVLVLVATFGFGAEVLGHFWEFAVVVLLGTLSFMALGLMLVFLVPSFEAANLTVQMLSLPMSFLCGVFFKVEAMPAMLRWLAHALPLTYLVDLARGVVSLGTPVTEHTTEIAMLASWFAASVIVCLFAYRRWNRDTSR